MELGYKVVLPGFLSVLVCVSIVGIFLTTTSSKVFSPPRPRPRLKHYQPAEQNPGCTERKLAKYKAVDQGVVYNHPSLVQYAKLAMNKEAKAVNLTFMNYMALLSAYKFLQPEKIMIHSYTDITGKYWDLVQKWDTALVVNKVERVEVLGGREVPPKLITHHADFIKVRGLLEFGGTISDFDVIVVNGTRWKELQRRAECVLSQEFKVINAGFNSCIRNSSFVRGWLQGYYRDYRRDWLYNAARLPTKILEDKSSSLCYNMHVVSDIATQPNWSSFRQWLKVDGVKWRGKIAAHYFNTGIKHYNETALQANSSFGELLRHVAQG